MLRHIVRIGALGVALSPILLVSGNARADVPLGPFDFNSAQFGNTLAQSDGGTYANQNWLNTVNANPGSPAFLTGPNFNTGIANIGLTPPNPIYTIGYNTPIVNGAGNDLGVVVARFSSDPVTIAFSTNGGATFTPDAVLPAASAVPTGVSRSYFYNFSGPFTADLWVHPLDLSTFGIPANAGVNAVRITGTTELDLVRVAGLVVPEPGMGMLTLIGAATAALKRRRR